MNRLLATLLLSSAVVAPALAQDAQSLLQDTRKQALPVLPKVVGMMQDTVAEKGAAGAIPVCKEKAPTLLKQRADELGWGIRRVSLKIRNPERGTPDVWEARHLADFSARAAAGAKPETLEVGEVLTRADGKREFRYMRAIPVAEVCLKCHGDAATIAPDLKAELQKQYPQDQATGYSKGQIRGALTVRRPL
ncbi:MAG: DUF3365 domain-containing protein [Betaproteobacteria bacterium]|nr:DUF3365 domain-containing protein [Betaproteobacteria bacterium]